MKTPIEPGMIARAVAGVRYALTGKQPDWFGPGDPLPPVAQEQAIGRQFDYPVFANTRLTPRAGEAVSFAQMRALADGYDLLRLVIETRKDQMVKLQWKVQPKDEDQKPDDRCKAVQAFLAFPDGEHNFQTWLRMALEDMFVIDAAAVYPRKTLGGAPYAFELIDGATIKRVIDTTGRTPLPPDPAYQQILKGLPAVDYSRDELVYMPRNVRTSRVYGYSQVEQIIMTVNIALRRQMNQLSYYTEGNTPNLIFGVPDTWNPDQIKAFQGFWDSINAGQSKHSAKFVPGGVNPIDTKAQALKDEFDEWLARIVCYAFSVPPTPFIKSNNKATAESAQDSALQEGLQPLMQWVEDLMNTLIWRYFGYTDLCFAWQADRDIAPDIQAAINDKKLRNGSRTINEVRADDGMEPVEGGDLPMIYTAQGAVLLKDVIAPPEHVVAIPGNEPPKPSDPEQAVKIEKKKHVATSSAVVDKGISKATRIIKRFLRSQVPDMIGQIQDGLDKLGKDDASDVERILAELDFAGWAVLASDIEPVLKRIAQDGGKVGLLQVGISDKGITDQVSKEAAQFAEDRGAELVGMKWVDDELVENPNAVWTITEGTREKLRSLVSNAIDEGWASQRLSDEVQDSQAFSDSRAETIGRTEIARAHIQGNLTAWKASGVVDKKEWLTAEACCDECAELDGMIVDIDDEFPGGDAPLHPNCLCVELPVLTEQDNHEDEE
jgi:SPP1 gp7 family putative phage head morphogenesis protein